ncbi:MAG: PAS domain-containing protein [Deltaproteobacteria bacterium]|nr:PAS domain-containing protein [Deltaproteobacteria bacterium]
MADRKPDTPDRTIISEASHVMGNDLCNNIAGHINSPTQLREILESNNDPLVIINGDHTVFAANKKFAEMLGYNPDELARLHVWDWETLFTPEQIKQASNTSQLTRVNFESMHRRKDGTLINVEVFGQSFKKDNEIWQVCLCRKIAECKEKELEIQKYQHNLSETQRIAHIGSWELDLTTGGFLCSDELKRIWGVEDEEENRILDIMEDRIHPEDTYKLNFTIQESIKNAVPYDIEYRIIDKQGHTRYMYTRSRLIKDSNGKAVRIYGICQDITDQRLKEEERRLNEKRLFQTQEIAHIGTHEYNVKTRELWWSDELYKIFGIDQKQGISSEKYLSHIHPDDQERLKVALQVGREDYYIEYRIIRPNGEIRYISNYVGKHEYKNGERYLIRGTGQDITERKLIEQENKQLELKLNHAQKMETIGTLAGGIAHDINNILGIIIGNTELCLDEVPALSPAHLNLEEIVKAVLRAKEVIRRLLTFSRNIDVKKEKIDIVSVVNDALEFLRSSISATVEIEKQINVANPFLVADPTQINQIILNLCANSAQAMETTGGTIKVKMENVVVNHASVNDNDLLANGEYIKIVISDDGPGIPAAIHDRIFDPYFTTKEVGKGSGMGLPVVQGIVKKHRGSINLKSDTGKGTSFTILLPGINEDKTVNGNGIKGFPAEKRILFVDDEEQIAKVSSRMLESLGYIVDTETNPIDALELIKKRPERYHLVITDMAMPQMNALMFFEEIRKIRKDMPVILCSGHNPLVDEQKALEAGFSAYVLKPFTRLELASAVQNVFRYS